MVTYKVPTISPLKERAGAIERQPYKPSINFTISKEAARALTINGPAVITLKGKIKGIKIIEGQLYSYDTPKNSAEVSIEPDTISVQAIRKPSLKGSLSNKLATSLGG